MFVQLGLKAKTKNNFYIKINVWLYMNVPSSFVNNKSKSSFTLILVGFLGVRFELWVEGKITPAPQLSTLLQSGWKLEKRQ